MTVNDKNLIVADDCNQIVDRSDSETFLEQAWEWYVTTACSSIEADQHRPICTRICNDDGRLTVLEIDDGITND